MDVVVASDDPLTAERAGEAMARVQRVAGGVGWVVHGLCFELSDGQRSGSFLTDARKPMDLCDDQTIATRNGKWETLTADERIVKVSGHGTTAGYLAFSVELHTSSGRSINFFGTNNNKRGRPFHHEAQPGKEIVELQFQDGTCTGIRTQLSDRGHTAHSAQVAPGETSQSTETTISPLTMAVAGDPNAYLEAFKTKQAWRAWIEGPSADLGKLQNEEFKATGQWTWACGPCNCAMDAGAEQHLPSQRHFANIWRLFSQLPFDGKQPSLPVASGLNPAPQPRNRWVQVFMLSDGRRYHFNHLSGERGWCEDIGESSLPPSLPPPPKRPALSLMDKESYPTTVEAAVSTSFFSKMPSVGSWLLHVPPRSEAAGAVALGDFFNGGDQCVSDASIDVALVRDSAPPTEAEDTCGSCVEAVETKEAWRTWMERPADRLEAVLNEDFRGTKVWNFACLFCQNKTLDGEHLKSQRHWKSVCGQLAAWHCLTPGGDCKSCPDHWIQTFELTRGRYLFNHLSGKQYWASLEERCKCELDNGSEKRGVAAPASNSLSQPVFKIAFVRRGNRPPPFGYEACIDRWAEYGPKPEGREYGWYFKKGGALDVWKLRCDPGDYVVVIGFAHGKFKHRFNGWVTGVSSTLISFGPENSYFKEFKRSIKLDDHIEVSGQCVSSMCYLQLWKKDLSGAPAFQQNSFSGARRGVVVPSFSDTAHGTPADWNSMETSVDGEDRREVYWGRRAKPLFRDVPESYVDVCVVLDFLEGRLADDGTPVRELLGPPVRQSDGWFSFAWLEHTQECEGRLRNEGWERAWHGCKLEALYSIMYHGILCESRDEDLGERILHGAPGVYVHKDGTSHKANNYTRFVDLCGDGVFWAAKWEVRVDRAERVKAPRQTDQWVQRASGVRLAALWLCGRVAGQMCEGDAVSRTWDPELEAHPRDGTRRSLRQNRVAEPTQEMMTQSAINASPPSLAPMHVVSLSAAASTKAAESGRTKLVTQRDSGTMNGNKTSELSFSVNQPVRADGKREVTNEARTEPLPESSSPSESFRGRGGRCSRGVGGGGHHGRGRAGYKGQSVSVQADSACHGAGGDIVPGLRSGPVGSRGGGKIGRQGGRNDATNLKRTWVPSLRPSMTM
eukprot:TRINITY_DN17910_c0_g1_i1.p1 TRINITY_DN17910_c0_g1~~TRINITY_DN17910_c0_g1_i1.p1  ORF type:complete len:1126 (+),score=162.57 TRINITY_DN17910_c0_g1_i1:197-3574(+)